MNKNNNDEMLSDYMENIDRVDAEIMKKLEERMELSEKAAICKKSWVNRLAIPLKSA